MSRLSDMVTRRAVVIITGYPRSMRDVVEYTARVEMSNLKTKNIRYKFDFYLGSKD